MNKIRLLNGVLNAISKDLDLMKKDIDVLKMKERLTEVENCGHCRHEKQRETHLK